MGGDLEQVNLDVGSNLLVLKTVSNMIQEVSEIGDHSEKLSRLDFYIRALEDESGKIDGFKRELPYCMNLLDDAIGRLEEVRLQWKRRDVDPVMEEFIPLCSDSEEDGRAKRSADYSDKKNWMSSAQLWSTPVEYENNFDIKNQESFLHKMTRCQEVDETRHESPFHGCNFKNKGGAFVPFKRAVQGVIVKEEERGVEGLSLSIPEAEVGSSSMDLSLKGGGGYGRTQLQQPNRKQRRCWSPELHKRFVNALDELGGAQTATPKQIRELMKVDGLTNDEVKSHLQKYRLHIRKLPTSSAGISSCSWLTRDQCRDMPTAVVSQSGSPQGPLHLARGVKIVSTSMEEDDDEKSESHNWKGQDEKLMEGQI